MGGAAVENYDIFISFRNKERDTAMAESLYHALQAKGYRPFFSKYSIADRSEFVDQINQAMESAKILVAVGSCRENLISKWVKKEINLFTALMMREEEGNRTLISYRSSDFPVDELPVNLADQQSFASEDALILMIDACLKRASGFVKDEDNTCLLYETFQQAKMPSFAEKQEETASLQIGDLVQDRYEILKQVGEGGMSRVYLALEQATNRQYAIKEVRRDGKMDFDMVCKSLETEISFIQHLNHPNIPKIYDVIRTDYSLQIVMEYIEGESLRLKLEEKGAFSETEVREIGQKLAELLDYLHNLEQPIIYRDLKPANVMRKADGSLKLVDFGTARYYRPEATGDTTCLGTIGYAAPEQFGGMGQTDARTDIYALGVTLYQLVTGKNPAEPPYEILPIRQVNPELSAGLEYILQKCTQKDPTKRFQTAADLLIAFRDIHKLGKRSAWRNFCRKKRRRPSQLPPSPPPPPRIVPPSSPKSNFAIPGQTTTPAARPITPVPPPPAGPQPRPAAPQPVWPPRNTPAPKPFAIPGSKTPSQQEMDEITRKLADLDPETRKLIFDLIRRLHRTNLSK